MVEGMSKLRAGAPVKPVMAASTLQRRRLCVCRDEEVGLNERHLVTHDAPGRLVAKISPDEHAQLLHRAPGLLDRHCATHDPGGGARRGEPSDRPVSAGRSATGNGDDQLPRRQCGRRRAVGGRSDRAAGQWLAGHALHELEERQRRLLQPDGDLRHRHRQEHRCGRSAEPGRHRAEPASRRRDPQRHHRTQVDHRLSRSDRADVAGAPLRRRIPEQLRTAQSVRRAGPGARRRSGAHLRRARLQHADLARPRAHGAAGRHRLRHRQRRTRAERRRARRAASACLRSRKGQQMQYTVFVKGRLASAARIREHRHPGSRERSGGAPQGRGPRRARRRRLLDQRRRTTTFPRR